MSKWARRAAAAALSPLLEGVELVKAVREMARDLSDPSLVREVAHRMILDCCDAGGCPECGDPSSVPCQHADTGVDKSAA